MHLSVHNSYNKINLIHFYNMYELFLSTLHCDEYELITTYNLFRTLSQLSQSCTNPEHKEAASIPVSTQTKACILKNMQKVIWLWIENIIHTLFIFIYPNYYLDGHHVRRKYEDLGKQFLQWCLSDQWYWECKKSLIVI